jgi:hypothetical protein
MKARKYQMPEFLVSTLTQQRYEKWLGRKASAHVRRDKARGNQTASREKYKIAIHEAVIKSGARDHYTGEMLDWALLSRYNNAESKAQKRAYKSKFALLPSVDHIGDGLSEANFKICGWRTNDAKNDLSHDDFVALCRRVVEHHDSPKPLLTLLETLDPLREKFPTIDDRPPDPVSL